MKSFAALAFAGAVMAFPQPAAVTSAISPSSTDPAGCSSSYDGAFEISVVNVSSVSKRALQARKALTITLADGVLTDDEGRTGYIASNYQFQFDNPVQAGAIYTSGWSVCSNDTLALGDSAIFWECLSGTFYNLYDESTGAQCSEIYIDVIPVDSSSTSTTAAASVSQVTDGQVQATTAVVSQISDGQIQATTATAAVVSQISDGQIQAATSTAAVVSQISDGQIQAGTSTTSAAVVSQISDGQIQAGTSTSSTAVVTQISDGQVQAGTTSAAAYSTGVVAATTNGTTISTASPTASTYTGGAPAATAKAGAFGLAAGAIALALF